MKNYKIIKRIYLTYQFIGLIMFSFSLGFYIVEPLKLLKIYFLLLSLITLLFILLYYVLIENIEIKEMMIKD